MESHLRARRRDLELELTRLTRFRDQQQQLFHQARRERETFSILREHQLREYQRNQSRREQRLLDELFLSRQSFRKRG
jgi:flagellar export protein FliJ